MPFKYNNNKLYQIIRIPFYQCKNKSLEEGFQKQYLTKTDETHTTTKETFFLPCSYINRIPARNIRIETIAITENSSKIDIIYEGSKILILMPHDHGNKLQRTCTYLQLQNTTSGI